MFKIIKIEQDEIYERQAFNTLKRLTNSGHNLRMFGSAMLEGLCDTSKPITVAYVAKECVSNTIVAWGCIIKGETNKSGHVFVHPMYREEGLGKRIILKIVEETDSLEFYPVSQIGYSFYNKFVDPSNISTCFLDVFEEKSNNL